MTTVYVVTEGDDPFMEGGRPVAAFTDEQDAWDYMSKQVAILGRLRWESEKRSGGRMSQADAARNEASVWTVWPVRTS